MQGPFAADGEQSIIEWGEVLRSCKSAVRAGGLLLTSASPASNPGPVRIRDCFSSFHSDRLCHIHFPNPLDS